MATMVNMNSLLNGKDSRWLQLEVCREFQRNKCSRVDTECKFAHPPANVEVQNGRVTACYDSIKGRCNREKPPCKYFHPPQHLKDQLLINGRNHLALKNALMQQMGLTPGQVLPGQMPAVVGGVSGAGAAASHLAALDPLSLALLAPQWDVRQATSPYLSGVPGVGSTYAQFYGPQLVPAVLSHDPAAAAATASPLGVVQQPVLQQKLPRTDRLEMDMKSVGSFYYDNFAFPGMVPYKRPAADKAGMPVYQPATTYQQLMQLQQPFVPVSCEYPAPASSAPPVSAAPALPALPPAPSAAAGPAPVSITATPAPAPPPVVVSAAPPQLLATATPSPAIAQPAPTAHQPPHTPPLVANAATAEPERLDPAAVAKEVAQKSYAAALALAAQQSAMAAQAAQAAAAYTGAAFKARAVPGLMRAPLMMRPGWPAPPVPMPAYYQQPYMYAVPPPTPPAAAAAAAAAASVASNPYKKMKTT